MDKFDFRWEGNFLDRPPRQGGRNNPNGVSAMFLVLFLAILLALSLASCESKDSPLQVEQKKVPASPGFTSSIEALPSPGKYVVHLKWSGYQTDGLWVVSRKDAEGGFIDNDPLSGQKTDYDDSSVEEGKTYTYYLSSILPGGHSTLATIQVKIPVDFIVTGTVRRSGEVVANRVFFEHGARLLTDGQDLRLKAVEITSEDGVIETFPEGHSAPAGASGRPGGRIVVKARRGHGVLTINGRGEDGGIGLPGRVGQAGKPGAKGRDAYCTHEKANVVCNCGETAKKLQKQIQAGGFAALFARQQLMMLHQQHRCIQETGDGQPGEQGQAGENGHPGGRGGDSAQLEIQVQDATNLQIKASGTPGKGGLGGPGGNGGPGGQGGAPGDHVLDYFFNCRVASPGAMGPQGQPGMSGSAGRAGNEFPICLKLGSASFGGC